MHRRNFADMIYRHAGSSSWHSVQDSTGRECLSIRLGRNCKTMMTSVCWCQIWNQNLS